MTFAELTIGTVINYNSIGQDTDYVFLGLYSDNWGNHAKFLDKSDNEITEYPAKTKVSGNWSLVKAN